MILGMISLMKMKWRKLLKKDKAFTKDRANMNWAGNEQYSTATTSETKVTIKVYNGHYLAMDEVRGTMIIHPNEEIRDIEEAKKIVEQYISTHYDSRR